jgi:hypothetical protein
MSGNAETAHLTLIRSHRSRDRAADNFLGPGWETTAQDYWRNQESHPETQTRNRFLVCVVHQLTFRICQIFRI